MRAVRGRARPARGARRRASARTGGWQALVVFTGTPDWAAAPAARLRARRRRARARPPRPTRCRAYRRLIAACSPRRAQAGAELRYWSPWNEPNHPYFLSPQRAALRRRRAARAAVAPTRARARDAADARRGARRPAARARRDWPALLEPTARATSVPEFDRAACRASSCARAPVWSQHAYVGGARPGGDGQRGARARRCRRRHAIWITETGVGAAPRRPLARARDHQRAPGLPAAAPAPGQWYSDPRVTVAAQYTFREDDLFPTGLVTTDLARAPPRAARVAGVGPTPDPPRRRPPAPAC